MDLKELVLRIRGDSSGAESALGKVQGATSKFGGVVKAVIAGAAVAAVVAFGKSCINAAAESESAEALLRNSLGNIKGMTDKNKQAAVDWVNAMESSKKFDDADLGAALQRLTVKTGSLKNGQDAVNVAMEVARFKHISLEAATVITDGAYNGMTRTLKEFGIEVGPDGKPLKGMAALQALQEKVKGSGDAWSKTMEGQRETFKTTFGNFQEAVGTVLMPLATKFMELIMPFLVKAMEWIQDHMPQIQAVMTTVINGISMAFTIAGDIINGIVQSITWAIEKVQAAITWVKDVAANKGVNQGGVYAPATASPTNASTYWHPPGYAAGGWVGLGGPEIALVGEKGPELITPAGQTPGNDRAILNRLDDLILAVTRVAPGVSSAINGLGASR